MRHAHALTPLGRAAVGGCAPLRRQDGRAADDNQADELHRLRARKLVPHLAARDPACCALLCNCGDESMLHGENDGRPRSYARGRTPAVALTSNADMREYVARHGAALLTFSLNNKV